MSNQTNLLALNASIE
ncbi:hypothetical protein ACT4US_18290, partial [Bacillus sp. HC-Mk]